MNEEQLRSAGFSDKEVEEYIKLQSAGFSESEINDYYQKKAVPSGPSISSRLWEGFKSNLEGLGRFAAQPTKTGQQLGSMLGTPEGREEIINPAVESIKKSIAEPSGIPGRIADYAIDNPLNTALDLAWITGLAGKAGALSKIAKASEPLAEAVVEADKFTPKLPNLTATIKRGIQKGIRPSVSGKASYPQMERYYQQAESGVKSIVSNKGNLEYLTDTGDVIRGKLPETLNEFADAINQTKKNIFEKYDVMARKSGEAPARIQLEPIARELEVARDNPAIRLNRPEIANYLTGMAERYREMGSLNPVEAQAVIKDFNNSLKSFYKNPTYEAATRASVDAMVVNRLRGSLDDFISQVTGPGYQELKNEYGALKSIEKDVTHRATVDARKNIKGLIDFSNIWAGTELVTGIMSMSPVRFARAAFIEGFRKYIKHINDPNRIISDMFKKVDKVHERYPWEKTTLSEYGLPGMAKTVSSAQPNPIQDLIQIQNMASRIQEAMNKPAFMRTAEDRLVLLNAIRQPETMRLTPNIVSPNPPVPGVTKEALTPSRLEPPVAKPLVPEVVSGEAPKPPIVSPGKGGAEPTIGELPKMKVSQGPTPTQMLQFNVAIKTKSGEIYTGPTHAQIIEEHGLNPALGGKEWIPGYRIKGKFFKSGEEKQALAELKGK